MNVLAYFGSFGKAEANLPKAVYAELVDSLYGPLGSLMVASTAGSAVAIGVSWESGSVPVIALAGTLVAISVGRVVLALMYRLSPRDDDLQVSRRWELRYAIGAYAFSGCLGALSFVIFAWTTDPVDHLLLNALAIGYTAGVAARNSKRLRIAYPQLALTLLPIAAGAALRVEPAYFLLTAITLLYFLATIEISRYLSANYIGLLLTTREKSELAHSLEGQNFRFDAALSNMSHGLLMLDTERRLVVWNDRFCEVLGLPPDVVRAGETVREAIMHSVTLGNHAGGNDADLEAMVSNCERSLESRAPARSRTQLADGRIVSLSQRPIADGGAVVIFEDVTEHDRAEQKSREQEILFRGLVENGMSGIVMVDADGTIVYANPTFAEMAGTVSNEAVGHQVIDFITLADRQKVRSAAETLFAGRQSVAQVTATLLQKGGGTIDTLSQGSLTTFQGKPSIVVVLLDITERRRSEAKIAELNAQMATTLAVLQRHVRDQTEIAQLSHLLQSCTATAEAYPIIAASAEVLFPQASGALALVQTGTRELTRMAAWGTDTDQTILPEFIVDDCWALRTGQRHEVEGPEGAVQCRHFNRTPAGPYICLPLTVQGETRGSLHSSFGEGSIIDSELRQAMQSFGDVIKLSLVNINLRESLGHQALRDQLTGLFNRRYLLETLPREIRRAQRSGSPLTIAMLEIDFFKRFNDTYGRGACDLVLSELSHVLRESLRAEDIACRYGDGELLVVLPDCDLATARIRLTQIFLLVKGKAHVFRGQALPSVTLSVGLAALSETLPDDESLTTAAGKAMYLAKTNGRDRIEDFLTPESGGTELAPTTAADVFPVDTIQDDADARLKPPLSSGAIPTRFQAVSPRGGRQ